MSTHTFFRASAITALSTIAFAVTATAANAQSSRYGNVYDYESSRNCGQSCASHATKTHASRYGYESGAHCLPASCGPIAYTQPPVTYAQPSVAYTQPSIGYTTSSQSYAGTPATCPAGTIAQGDGTCLQTGGMSMNTYSAPTTSYAAPTTSYSNQALRLAARRQVHIPRQRQLTRNLLVVLQAQRHALTEHVCKQVQQDIAAIPQQHLHRLTVRVIAIAPHRQAALLEQRLNLMELVCSQVERTLSQTALLRFSQAMHSLAMVIKAQELARTTICLYASNRSLNKMTLSLPIGRLFLSYRTKDVQLIACTSPSHSLKGSNNIKALNYVTTHISFYTFGRFCSVRTSCSRY